MKRTILASLILFSTSAMADFSGNWQGSGLLKVGDGTQSSCPVMSLNLTHTAGLLTINSGHFDCGDFSINWMPFAIEVRGNKLISNGQEVGTIDQSKLHATQVDPQSKMTSTYDAQINAGVMTYDEIYLCKSHKTLSNAFPMVAKINFRILISGQRFLSQLQLIKC